MKCKKKWGSYKNEPVEFEEALRTELVDIYVSGQLESVSSEVEKLRECLIFVASKLSDTDKKEYIEKFFIKYEVDKR